MNYDNARATLTDVHRAVVEAGVFDKYHAIALLDRIHSEWQLGIPHRG